MKVCVCLLICCRRLDMGAGDFTRSTFKFSMHGGQAQLGSVQTVKENSLGIWDAKSGEDEYL